MQHVKLILKKIQDAMIRLEIILLDIKQQLAKKTNAGHSHDISNITGLEHILESRASVNHTHHAIDIVDLDKWVKKLIEPKFIIQTTCSETEAAISIKLLSTQGYCMHNILLKVDYREAFGKEWHSAKECPFIYGQPIQATIKNLTPSTAYHIRLIAYDKHSPLMKLEVTDMFKTQKEAI